MKRDEFDVVIVLTQCMASLRGGGFRIVFRSAGEMKHFDESWAQTYPTIVSLFILKLAGAFS